MKKRCVNCDFSLPQSHLVDCPFCGLSPDLKGKKSKWSAISVSDNLQLEPLVGAPNKLALLEEGVTTFSRVQNPAFNRNVQKLAFKVEGQNSALITRPVRHKVRQKPGASAAKGLSFTQFSIALMGVFLSAAAAAAFL